MFDPHAINTESNDMLTQARKLSGEKFSVLINLSGRRRFTSQRVVLY